MAAYATPPELALWMPGFESGFTEAQTQRAELLLDTATGVIDDETGQNLHLATTTDTWTHVHADTLVLSRWPVTDTPTVTVDGTVLVAGTDYDWDLAGVLTRLCGATSCAGRHHHRWCFATGSAVYPAGYNPIPPSVRGLCLELCAAAWESPGGKKSVRIGDFAVTAAERGGLSLTTKDKKVLGRYSANR